MSIRKRLKEMDRQVSKGEVVINDDYVTINVKAEEDENIFSKYNFDTKETISEELKSYVIDKTKFVAVKSDVRVKIFTEKDADENEIKNAFKNTFKEEYKFVLDKIKTTTLFSVAMLITGLVFLGFLILQEYLLNLQFLYIILEVATWVFIWEAVDAFFLERAALKRKRVQMMKLYEAQVEVVKIIKPKAKEIQNKM